MNDPAPATRRAVRDVLAQGVRGDVIESAVGVELGTMLLSGVTADVGDGASPAAVLWTLREECGQAPVTYAWLLELLTLASLDELQVIAGLDAGDLERITSEVPPAPPRRSSRRRR